MKLVDHALEYAANNWHVLPVRGKVPLPARGSLDATTDPDQIRQWWEKWPDANIGVSTVLSDLVVLDIDVKPDTDGFQSLREFEAEHGDMPETAIARTGGGGAHLIYTRGHEDVVPQKLGFRDGLDLLSKNFFIAPPSLHESGDRYEWERTCPPVPLPPSLRRIARVAATSAENVIDVKVGQGNRNHILFSVAGSLRARGLSYQTILAALKQHNSEVCNPPLGLEELERIVSSAMRYDADRDPVELLEFAEALGIPRGEKVQSNAYTLVSDVASEPHIPIRKTPLSLAGLNQALQGGIRTRQLTIAMAKPGAGKTAWVLHESIHVQKSIPVLYVSTELERLEVMARLAANAMEGSSNAILEGHVTKHVQDAVQDMRIGIVGCDEIPHNSEEAVARICAAAEKLGEDFGEPPLVIVDYLQDLVSESAEGMRGQVGQLAVAFRSLAQRLDCPVLAVCAISRAAYGAALQALRTSEDASVYLPLAKESGKIDYAAAVILHIDVLEDDTDWRPGRIAVAKCRHGRVGFAGVQFHGATGRWRDYAEGVTEVAKDATGEKAKEKDNDTLKQALFDKIRELANEPLSDKTGPVSAELLQAMVPGGKKTQKLRLIEELRADRLVRDMSLVGYDSDRVKTKRKAVVPIDYNV